MIKKALAALVLAGVTSAVILFGSMSQAAAIPLPSIPTDTCSTVPAPTPPRDGLSGHMTVPPGERPPADADPFADGSKYAIHDVYGTSWAWSLYNCELVPDPVNDGGWSFNTMSANFVLDLAEAGVAVLWTLERLAKEAGIGWFGEWVAQTAEAITPMVFGSGGRIGLFSLAVGVMFLALLFRFKTMDFANIMRSLGVLLICTMLAVFTLAAPAEASKAADSVARSAAQIGTSAAGHSLTDTINRQALYQSWLAGWFGDPTSKTAEKYGPELVKATSYTWHEWDVVQADPEGRGKEITGEKAKAFKQIASDVEKENPAAYTHFTGRADRVGHALWAVLVGTVQGVFVLIALVMVMLGRFLMQIVVVATPIAAVAGLLPNGTGVLMKLWDFFFAGVVTVFKFTLAVGIMTALLGRLSTIDPVSALIWMALASAAFFRVLKPAQSFKQLTPGLDPNRKYFKEALALAGTAGAAVATGGGSLAATAATAATAAGSKPDDDEEQVTAQVKPEAPPKPTFITPEGATKPVRVAPQPATADKWDGAAPPTVHHTETERHEVLRHTPTPEEPLKFTVINTVNFDSGEMVDEAIFRPSRVTQEEERVGIIPVPADRTITPSDNPIVFRPSEQKVGAKA